MGGPAVSTLQRWNLALKLQTIARKMKLPASVLLAQRAERRLHRLLILDTLRQLPGVPRMK